MNEDDELVVLEGEEDNLPSLTFRLREVDTSPNIEINLNLFCRTNTYNETYII